MQYVLWPQEQLCIASWPKTHINSPKIIVGIVNSGRRWHSHHKFRKPCWTHCFQHIKRKPGFELKPNSHFHNWKVSGCVHGALANIENKLVECYCSCNIRLKCSLICWEWLVEAIPQLPSRILLSTFILRLFDLDMSHLISLSDFETQGTVSSRWNFLIQWKINLMGNFRPRQLSSCLTRL